MSKCPVYKEAIDAAPWRNAIGANAGLVFDKFPDAWDQNQGKWEFDKSHVNDANSTSWLKRFAGKTAGNPEGLREACARQETLIRAMGGEVVYLTNVTRFVTGMGREHPLENGFTWHHSLGVPYLPGTGVKGVLRAWLREEGKQEEAWFGSQGDASRVTLLDMLPTAPPQLAVEIMTPHYSPYYQNGEAPGDWHSPNPISYLAVDAGATWQLGILPAPGQRPVTKEDVVRLKAELLEALDWLGAGAKTATGYGQFREDQEVAKAQKAAAEQQARETEARRKKEEEDRKREQELSKLPPDLAALRRRADTEDWSRDKSALLDGMERLSKRVAGADRGVRRMVAGTT